MTSEVSRGVWFQLAAGGLALVTVVLLGVGWWPLSIFTGLAAAACFWLVRKAVVEERVDEVILREDEDEMDR